ncbi:hypothetical protein HDK90DRAFT_125219 [Phyllosticta capitalensis]|uniref:Uncharacterized protein n=2 Tax=Phyllosticta capitalensis TaxID=121624 RepID=A0ABR1YXV9_9PEZI
MMCIGADVSHPAPRWRGQTAPLVLTPLVGSRWHVAALGVGLSPIASGTTSSSSLHSVKSKIPLALPSSSLSSVYARARLSLPLPQCASNPALERFHFASVVTIFSCSSSTIFGSETNCSVSEQLRRFLRYKTCQFPNDHQRQPSTAKPVNPTWFSRTPVQGGWLTRYFCLPSATGVDRGAPADDRGRPGVHWIHHRRNGHSALDDWVGV